MSCGKVEDSELTITKTPSASQNVTNDNPREKPNKWPAHKPKLSNRKKKEGQVDPKQNLQNNHLRRTFFDDDAYHLQSTEANHIHSNEGFSLKSLCVPPVSIVRHADKTKSL